MKQGYTHIAVVLDSSGSMGSIIDDTIGGFNTFLDAQKNAEGEATLSLYEFQYPSIVNARGLPSWHWQEFNSWGKSKVDVAVNTKFTFLDIKHVANLNKENYRPNGGTPLLDTVGQVIKDTGEQLAALSENLRPSKVLFVIITDGEENASHVYNFDSISKMIKHQRDTYKWEFVFLGANQDAIGEASKMGIGSHTSMAYGTSQAAIHDTYNVLASKTAAFRSFTADAGVLAFTDQERTVALGEDQTKS